MKDEHDSCGTIQITYIYFAFQKYKASSPKRNFWSAKVVLKCQYHFALHISP